MKKTLITLWALSGLAMATTVTQSAAHVNKRFDWALNQAGYTSSQDFTLSLTIDSAFTMHGSHTYSGTVFAFTDDWGLGSQTGTYLGFDVANNGINGQLNANDANFAGTAFDSSNTTTALTGTVSSTSEGWFFQPGGLNGMTITLTYADSTMKLNITKGDMVIADGVILSGLNDASLFNINTMAKSSSSIHGPQPTVSAYNNATLTIGGQQYNLLDNFVDFYWEAGNGNWNWSDAKWSTIDNNTSDLAALPTGGTVNVFFNNSSETATISIGSGAGVTSMSIDAGNYTFTGENNSKLSVEGALSVANGATADIRTDVKAGSISTSGTLNITGDIETSSITVNTAGVLNLSDANIDKSWTITNNGNINLSGTINLTGAWRGEDTETLPASGNGFATITTLYEILGGNSSAAADTSWQINGTAINGLSISYTNGSLEIINQGTEYYVSNDTVIYDNGAEFTGATGITVNGGTLRIATDTIDNNFIQASDQGGTIDLNGYELAQSALENLAGEVELSSGSGAEQSVYYLGNDTALKQNVSLGSDWAGTVRMDSINDSTLVLNIDALGHAGSHIKLGAMNVMSISSSGLADVTAESLAIAESSHVAGNLTLNNALTLGSTGNAAQLTADGSVSTDTIILGNAASKLEAQSLITTGDTITICLANQQVLEQLNAAAAKDSVTIITLDEAYAGSGAELSVLTRATAANKYYTSLEWDTAKKNLLYQTWVNENYVSELVGAKTLNGRTGETLLQQAFMKQNPQTTAPDGALAMALNMVDAGSMTENTAAAIAGASSAAMGAALSGDTHRQLQAIRNRTTSMGVDQCVVHHDMPYFNAWINAEANRAELDKDGTESGYSMDSWGGTVGFDVDLTPQFTVGMAFSAMYGDFTAKSEERATGDMDTYYLSAFSRYVSKRWTHTFVASVGMAQSELKRTVSLGKGSYTTEGDSDGFSLGAMYEVGYVYALDEDATACLQPVLNFTFTHSSLGGYTESGSDAALKVSDMDMTTFTIGAGARVQATLGENIYNRSSICEARALLKLNAGDTNSEGDVALASLPGAKGSITSAEEGVIGLELGVGLTIPVLQEGGDIFFDASAEISSGYTNVNATAGYRYNF